MTRKSKVALLLIVLLITSGIAGCQLNVRQIWQKTKPDEPELINVEMHFANREVIHGYVKNLGVDLEGKVYNGGSSVSYIYDQRGRIIGAFNYARLEYMLIVP